MLRIAVVLALATPCATLAEGQASAEAAAEGRKLARMCSACHGRDGVAVRPHTPDIAGLDPDYLAEQLAAYRDGARRHEEMNVVARPLSDGQIASLAAWFASQAPGG